MPSVKTRVAITGGKYLLTHPRSRLTRFVVRFAARNLGARLATATHVEAIPATRGSRLTTLGGIVLVAGGVVFVARRGTKTRDMPSPVTVPAPHAPFPPTEAATAPPEPPDTVAPVMSPVAEAAAITALEAEAAELGDGDDALVARVRAALFGGTPPVGLTVESHSGVVTLRGKVADEESEGRIVRDAEQIEGVKAVQSELQTAGAEPGAPDV